MTAAPTGVARTAQILRFLLKYRSAGVFTGLDMDAAAEQVDDHPASGTPEQFVSDLEALGPTFVKIGQALSTRPDMVPPAYLEALERMQDDVAPVPFPEVREVLEQSLGVRLTKPFVEFEEVPIGCASLAQVHRARLRDGRMVAVKVQRPSIEPQIRADLDAIGALARRADQHTRMGRDVHFADWVQEFRRALLGELDYRQEAENLERFGKHLADYPQLYVPSPLWDLCGDKVLTMDLVEGTKVTEVSGLRRTEEHMDDLARALMRGYLDQVFVHGEIHADPHPGNLLVTPDGRLALFDMGMIAHVPPRMRERLLKLLFAAVDGRGEAVANESIAMGTRLEHFDAGRYQREVGQMVARYAAHASGRTVSEGRLMLDLVRLGTACGLRTPPELSLLGKTLLNLERVADALAPDIDVREVVEGHLDGVMRGRLRKALSPSSIATELMEVQALLRDAPRKVSDLLSLLADNRFKVQVGGLDKLMESLQKIANRIAAGVITASLIIGAALMMRVDTGPRLFGYPAIALVMFLVGAGLGIAIVVNSLRSDLKAKPKEERGPD
ncbi:MAG TPA: AarF/UbiB family protein [Xanthomonadaceae bacterium]|nr:AarF/UbiB family protein [Xanthomonadaceae bacterium]